MKYGKLVGFLTLIVLHVIFFRVSYNFFIHSSLNNYLNVAKSAIANKSIEVSVNDIDIQQSVINPDQLIVTLLVSEKNTGNSVASPANYSLSTQDGFAGIREVLYGNTWKPLNTVSLAPGQQSAGAVSFEIKKSDNYEFTYTRGYQAIHYEIPSDKGLFVPFVINNL